MKRLLTLLFILAIISCNNSDKEKTVASENDVDAARNFIRSALDGNYSQARQYMVRDSLNDERIETAERNYQHNMNTEDKRGYREASITIYDTRTVNDSEMVVSYANSFKNKKDSLKVVRLNGQWLVDLKYTLLPLDTTRKK
jgi:hypothetical protein